MAWVRCSGGKPSTPDSLYLVENGVSNVPYSGDAVQYPTYLQLSRGYNADFHTYVARADVTDYSRAIFKWTNADNVATPAFYVGTTGYTYGSTASGTVTIDITGQTGYVDIVATLRMNNSSFRLTEVVLVK